MDNLNLDALIPREDFEISDHGAQSSPVQTIQIRDLEKDTFFYPVLRKPDFQRETADWDVSKVSDFIRSFLDGDLIPAIILWHSGSDIFVIDGSHRLSALVAWVHDDYGDGVHSTAFFEHRIPEQQLAFAEKVRRLIKRTIGSYADHRYAIQNPEKAQPEMLERAKRLASLALQLQWVKGDAHKAEASFFKINQQAAPIDKTELRILQARKKPNALAARAIIRSGTGHKYWSKFSEEAQIEIQEIAKEINDILFTPALRTPIKTLDLPIAGRGYSSKTLLLILELINLVNDVKESELADDPDGKETIDYLKKTRKVVNRISGTHASSLGMHPVVYFYSEAGRYQPTAFLAVVALLKEFEAKRSFDTFTRNRKGFEEFLLSHKSLSNQVTFKLGSGTKGFKRLQELYSEILSLLVNRADENTIISSLKKEERFSFLQFDQPVVQTEGNEFSGAVKSLTFIRDALKNPMKCGICGGLVHTKSISVDHIERKSDGGSGTSENAQLTHFYCNTTFKN